MKRKSPEYLEKRNILSLILFHVVFFLLDLFVILQPIFPNGSKNYKPFMIAFGVIFGIGVLAAILVAMLYKNNTTIHFKKQYDLANRILTYLYIAIFGVYLVAQFLNRSGKVSTQVVAIIAYTTGSILTLVSIAAITLNTIIIIKEKTDVPLQTFLEKQKQAKLEADEAKVSEQLTDIENKELPEDN